MAAPLKVGIIGDYRPAARSHRATDAALQHAAQTLAMPLDVTWLPTLELADGQTEAGLQEFDALWCAPGSPYQSMAGALQAIRYARQQGRPFIGT